MNVTYPETPAGKRSVKINIWGNVVGYVSGKRFWEFGPTNAPNETDSELWGKGYSLEDIYGGVAHEKEGLF